VIQKVKKNYKCFEIDVFWEKWKEGEGRGKRISNGASFSMIQPSNCFINQRQDNHPLTLLAKELWDHIILDLFLILIFRVIYIFVPCASFHITDGTSFMAKDEDCTFVQLPSKNLRKFTSAPLKNWHVSYTPLKIKLNN
jgi:hypothetical protein